MALYEDLCDNIGQYEYYRLEDTAEKKALDARLPGIVQSITSLPMQITVTDAKVEKLLDGLRDIRKSKNRLQAASFIAEVLPHLKMAKKHVDSFLADLLDLALDTKNADLENFCVSQIPAKFTPNTDRNYSWGFFAFSLFARAFLKGDEAEKEKYLHESLRLFLGKPSYGWVFSLQGHEEEVEELLGAKRTIVLKELVLEYLKKKKQDELYTLLSKAEFDWDFAHATQSGALYKTTLTLKVTDAEKITDAAKEQIKKVMYTVNPLGVPYVYHIETINYEKI
jgi:hypothetical protein